MRKIIEDKENFDTCRCLVRLQQQESVKMIVLVMKRENKKVGRGVTETVYS